MRQAINELRAQLEQQSAGEPPAPAVKLTTRRVGVTTVPDTHLSYVQYGALPLSPTMHQLDLYQQAAERKGLSMHAWCLQALDKAAA